MKCILSISCMLLAATLTNAEPSLQEKLNEFKSTFEAIAPKEKIDGYNAGVAAAKASGVLEKAKKAGDEAPLFALQDSSGKTVALDELLKEGPVVLTWYRGGWCPYCNITLAALQQVLPEITEAGAQLVALTPELPDRTVTTKEKNSLNFHVLTDLNNQVAKQYGIVFGLTEFVENAMREFANLKKWNGEAYDDKELPLSATYIIDNEGKIRWAFLDAEYRNRADPKEIVEQLKKLQ